MPMKKSNDVSELKDFKNSLLDQLDSINKFYIYKNIQIFDKLFDCPKMTDNCFTIRDRSYQQIFLVGTEGNRKPGTVLPFTLRAVDQYNRLAIVVKKRFKHCFNEQVIDVECPLGHRLAKLVGHERVKGQSLFTAFKCESKDIFFDVFGNDEKKNRNEFKVMDKNDKTIATIGKRYEKFKDRDKTLVYEDHYLRTEFEGEYQTEHCFDKAVVLSTALILSIFFIDT